MQGGTHMNVCAGSQHLRNIHVPKTITSAPFLQHPALSAGQKRYLCSIASVYSTEHMRQQVKRHYLNMLRTCLHSGAHLNGAVMDVTRATTLGQRKSSSNSATVNSEVILPKIVNR
uniref:Uncharacterized protein n=1 Tax=Mola mola TaxID=94237 RepID=A0A3Q3WWK7_MOLML